MQNADNISDKREEERGWITHFSLLLGNPRFISTEVTWKLFGNNQVVPRIHQNLLRCVALITQCGLKFWTQIRWFLSWHISPLPHFKVKHLLILLFTSFLKFISETALPGNFEWCPSCQLSFPAWSEALKAPSTQISVPRCGSFAVPQLAGPRGTPGRACSHQRNSPNPFGLGAPWGLWCPWEVKSQLHLLGNRMCQTLSTRKSPVLFHENTEATWVPQ